MSNTGLTDTSTSEAITAALVRLADCEPFSKITVAQLAQEVGVNRATFYRHFSNKEEVVRRLYQACFAEFVGRFRSMESADTRTYLLLMFSALCERREQLLALHRAGASYLLLDELTKAFGVNVAEGITDARLAYALAYHVGGIYNDLLLWFNRNMKETPAQMCDVALAVRPEGAFTLLHV